LKGAGAGFPFRPGITMRFFFLRIVLPLLLFLLLRSVLKGIFGAAGAQPARRGRPASEPVEAGGELKKDPVCGTYVSVATSLTRKVGGEVLHFCSAECRDKYHVA
jgi:YHS domain-containing protein